MVSFGHPERRQRRLITEVHSDKDFWKSLPVTVTGFKSLHGMAPKRSTAHYCPLCTNIHSDLHLNAGTEFPQLHNYNYVSYRSNTQLHTTYWHTNTSQRLKVPKKDQSIITNYKNFWDTYEYEILKRNEKFEGVISINFRTLYVHVWQGNQVSTKMDGVCPRTHELL